MLKLERIRILVVAAWCVGPLVWAAPEVATAQTRSAYERLDESRLAKMLKDLGMTELLGELVRDKAGAGDIKSKSLLAEARIAAALRAGDQAGRDRLLDQALKIQDELIAATKGALEDEAILQHYRFRLDRAITEGITKTEPYAERLSYFQARPGDAETVARLTKSALGVLNPMMTSAVLTRDDWAAGDASDERIVTGVADRLEELIREAEYRGAWIRLYRGMVLPAESAERAMLLRQAIVDVDKFADAEDNSSGVKFASLLLSGMAARELGEWDNARSFLKRAGDAQATPLIRLKALFETARTYMDQGLLDEAAEAVRTFRSDGAKLLGKTGAVAVDMQSALLKRRLLKLRAEKIKAADPAQAARLEQASVKALLEFIEKYPRYTEAFVEIIAAEFEGKDPRGLPPGILIAFGTKEFARKGYARAKELFSLALKSAGADNDVQATALWHLGLVHNALKKNDLAARHFRELAEKYPEHPRAKEAALFSVMSLQGILKQRKTTPAELGREFVQEYARSLEVLVRNWGEKDPKIRTYNYELGQQYEHLGRIKEAIAAFNRLDPTSELYIPSRFRILSLRAEALQNSASLKEADRRRLARDLIADLKAYRDLARKYVPPASDPQRAEQVRAWGAECDMRIAHLLKDILNESLRAASHARQVPQRWPKVPGLRHRSREFVVRVLLEEGKTDQAIEMLKGLTGAYDLVAEVVRQIRIRIDRLEQQPGSDVAEKLKEYRKAYKTFAEQLYEWAKDKKLPAARMYSFRQALAGANEFGSLEDVRKALQLYQELAKARPRDAINIRGLARCTRRLGMHKEAMGHYGRLIAGLPEKSVAWWRAQLERLQFGLELYVTDAKGLEEILLQIRVLDLKDKYLGGFWRQFNDVEAAARKRLKSLQGGATRPAAARAS